jgi:hypothetical protein
MLVSNEWWVVDGETAKLLWDISVENIYFSKLKKTIHHSPLIYILWE